MKKLYLLLFLCACKLSVSGQCWQSISAGLSHTLAIKSDGTLWSWGFNGNGQIGDGTTAEKSEPIQIGTASDWNQVVAGGNHSLALKSDGTIWAWGENLWGQLGDGTFASHRLTPTKIGTDNDWKFIFAGRTVSFAIKTNGTLWAWGDNLFGQLGHQIPSAGSPQQVGTEANWNTISPGGNHTLGLKTDGTLWAWGYNSSGELGDGTVMQRDVPTKIGTALDWQSISTGYDFSLALKTNGSLYTWGGNSEGQLGDGTYIERHSPFKIGTSTWQSISSGSNNSLGIKSDGTLWAWGWIIGRIGTNNNRSMPTQLGTANSWHSIRSGDNHSFAFQADGTLWGWGNNNWGALGDGTWQDQIQPQLLSTPTPTGDATQMFCNAGTLADLKATGTNISWYAAPSGGSPLINTTPLVDGAHYYATSTKNLCESPSRLDVTVLLNTTSTLVPTGATSQYFCGATSVGALAVTGLNVKWYSAALGGEPLDIATPLENAHYFASQTVDACESPRLDVIVTVNTTPAPTGNNSQTMCAVSTLSDLVVMGTDIKWYADENSAVVLPATATLVNGIHYYATQTIGLVESCTRLHVQVTLVSTPPPVGDINQIICTAGSVSDLQATGTSILWYDSPTGGSVVINGEPLVDGQHYFAAQYLNSCWSTTRLEVIASINSTPRPTGQYGQYFCSGATVADLQATGTSIIWYDAETGGNMLPSNTLLENGNSYFASQSIAGTEGCLRLIVAAGVGPNAAPSGESTQAFCNHGTIANLTTFSGNPVTWYASPAGNDLLAPSTALSNGTHYYASQTISGCESSNRLDVTVVVNTNPTPPPSGNVAQTFCGGTVSQLVATGNNVLWYESPTNPIPLFASDVLVDGKHYYGSQTISGCASASRLDVTVTILPVAGTPALVNPGWRLVSAGAGHNIGIKNDGTLWAWGDNQYNQLGAGYVGYVIKSPKLISNDNDWNIADAGTFHNAAIKNDGTLWVWGTNFTEQATYNPALTPLHPTQKGTQNDWKSVSAGQFFTVALKTDGTLWAWNNQSFESMPDAPVVQMGTDNDWIAISAGSFHTLALKANGTLWSWGRNSEGQLGDGTTINRNVPIRVGTDSDWKSITGGIFNSFAIKTNGTLWIWGAGTYLLVNPPAEKLSPKQLGSDTNWQSLAALRERTTGVKTDGTLWMWQTDYYNPQLPAQVETSTDWRLTVSGNEHSLAIKTDGTLWAWGSHLEGQLGLGDAASPYSTPQLVDSPSIYFQEICSGVISNITVQGQDVKWYTSSQGGALVDLGTLLQNNEHYYATQSIGICESPVRLDVLVVNDLVSAPTGASAQSFCDLATIANLTAQGDDIKWYDVPTGGIPLSSTTLLIHNTQYYATQVLNACESQARLEVVASVATTPRPGGNTDQKFCMPSTISNLEATGSDIKWYETSTGSSPILPASSLVNGAHYYASQTLSGCESQARLEIVVSVGTVSKPVANALQTFCGEATVANLAATGTQLQWYATYTGSSPLLPANALVNGSHYYASQTMDGCESVERLEVTAVVNSTATPIGNAMQSFCTQAILEELIVKGTEVKWYSAATGGFAMPMSTQLVNNASYFASQTLNGCETLNRLQVTAVINPAPAAPAGAASQTLETGDTITELVVAGSSITWYNSTQDAASGVNALPESMTIVSGSTYYATQTTSGCQGPPLAVTVALITGLESIDDQLRLYPNPIDDVLMISYNQIIDDVTVINLAGQTIVMQSVNDTVTQLDLSKLHSGIYFVVLRLKDVVIWRKALKL